MGSTEGMGKEPLSRVRIGMYYSTLLVITADGHSVGSKGKTPDIC